MTDDELNRLQAAASAATPAPWNRLTKADDPEGDALLVCRVDLGWNPLAHVKPFGNRDAALMTAADADFCVLARAAVPELVAEIRRLRKLLEDF